METKITPETLTDGATSNGKKARKTKAESPVVVPAVNSIPPANWKRNEYGLLEHVKYEYLEDCSVNWRKMIPSKYIVPNKNNFEKRGVAIPENQAEIEDKDLLILLAGFKEVGYIRGYTSVTYQVSVNSDMVGAQCNIKWIPNYESNMNSVEFCALADASVNNTQAFGRNYLSTIAENRAFVRAVRNFLKIHILGADEIGKGEAQEDAVSSSPTAPHTLLHKIINAEPKRFKEMEQFRNWAIANGYNDQHEKVVGGDTKWDANNWDKISKIPVGAISELIERLKKG